jgi:hypothetical protein
MSAPCLALLLLLLPLALAGPPDLAVPPALAGPPGLLDSAGHLLASLGVDKAVLQQARTFVQASLPAIDKGVSGVTSIVQESLNEAKGLLGENFGHVTSLSDIVDSVERLVGEAVDKPGLEGLVGRLAGHLAPGTSPWPGVLWPGPLGRILRLPPSPLATLLSPLLALLNLALGVISMAVLNLAGMVSCGLAGMDNQLCLFSSLRYKSSSVPQ